MNIYDFMKYQVWNKKQTNVTQSFMRKEIIRIQNRYESSTNFIHVRDCLTHHGVETLKKKGCQTIPGLRG